MNSQASHGSSTSSGAAKRRHSAEHEPVHEFGEQVWADLNSLCMDEHFSDVSFIVEDQRLPAHRIILGKRSNYFRELLCGRSGFAGGIQNSPGLPLLGHSAHIHTGPGMPSSKFSAWPIGLVCWKSSRK
ncbi:BTB/POZ domain-containing protein 9-like [Drosophila pseudoobscura]|uniref:BTB/POZ domain-containing protein 9-like n=1 Tax=Drosophila pseudoobscura pseudoobscura TaxID=46245 RepID=A0A6I8VX37_DROPS|nr:BTB/POZ domain-containing protein 9-like [Drosophila pseudoobscura]